jgi:UDP-3-O-[3-hydroxymyristoyl] glucosamine N-acyltransferase
MQFTAQQIAEFLKGTVVGNPDVAVSSFSKIEEGKPGTLTFLSNPKYTPHIYTTQASVVLVNNDFAPEHPVAATMVKVPDSYAALATLLQLADSMKPRKKGIDPLAFVSERAKLGNDVYVGAFAYIGDNVEIADGVQVYPNSYVGDNVKIGEYTTLFAGVTIYNDCVVGNQCIIHSGAVIGSDGFGFAPNPDGTYNKIPQIGNVVIEDNVEIGANTTIDRSTMGSTIIHKGVKLDNLIQIAHNVEVGENTAMAAQTGVAGSAKIGKNCVFAGKVGVVGHVTVADRTTLASFCCANSNIKESDKVWQGVPAWPITQFQRVTVMSKKLPDLFQTTLPDMQRTITELQKEIEELKNKIKE